MSASKTSIVMSATALVVAVLFATPLGRAAGRLVLPKNSVGSAQIVNGSLQRSDLSKKAIAALHGARGPQGTTGPKGVQGPVGPKGDKGVPGAATGAAGGDLSGTYPNPQIGAGKVTPGKISGIPAARVTRGSSNQLVPTDTLTYVEFDSKDFDTAGLYSAANPTELKAPIAGLYLLTASLRWEANATGTRFAAFMLGGKSGWIAPDWRNATGGGVQTDQEISTLVALQANETVQLRVYQTSGSPISLLWRADPNSNAAAPTLTMHWVGPAS